MTINTIEKNTEATPQLGGPDFRRLLGDLPARVLDVCKARGWSLHWTARGSYLHLEASELIEAIRGKHVCPDCGAAPGEQHKDGCDVERCPGCGGQYISCGCEDEPERRLPWTGEWPGVAECREFGWYSKLVSGRGWVPCAKNEPGAVEDLNSLHIDAVWSKEQGRFVLPL